MKKSNVFLSKFVTVVVAQCKPGLKGRKLSLRCYAECIFDRNEEVIMSEAHPVSYVTSLLLVLETYS